MLLRQSLARSQKSSRLIATAFLSMLWRPGLGKLLWSHRSVKGVTGAAQDILHLVTDEVFDGFAGGAHVLARIKFARAFREHFADAGGHRHAQISIDVHLGAT